MDKQHYVLTDEFGGVLAIVAGRHEAELRTYTRKAVAEHYQEPVNKYKINAFAPGADYDYVVEIDVLGPLTDEEDSQLSFNLIPAKYFSK